MRAKHAPLLPSAPRSARGLRDARADARGLVCTPRTNKELATTCSRLAHLRTSRIRATRHDRPCPRLERWLVDGASRRTSIGKVVDLRWLGAETKTNTSSVGVMCGWIYYHATRAHSIQLRRISLWRTVCVRSRRRRCLADVSHRGETQVKRVFAVVCGKAGAHLGPPFAQERWLYLQQFPDSDEDNTFPEESAEEDHLASTRGVADTCAFSPSCPLPSASARSLSLSLSSPPSVAEVCVEGFFRACACPRSSLPRWRNRK